MHVALVNIAASGHVNPSLPLVSELVRRGVRVSYWCTREYESVIRHAGAEFRPYQSMLASRMGAPVKPKLPDELPTLLMEEGEHVAAQIMASLPEDRPDALVTDSFAVAGRIVGRALDVPTTQLRATYAANRHFSFIRESCPGQDRHDGIERERALAQRLRAQYGVSAIDLYDIFEHEERLNIVFISPEFHPAGAHFGANHVLVGPQIGSRLDAGSWQPPAGDGPLVYVSFGTVFGNNPTLYPNLIEALGGGPWRAVVSIGNQPISGAAPNVQLVRHAPQLEVLAQADLFITHAGMNSVQESLWFGVPMIALPQMHEQAFTARRLSQLGLGAMLPDFRSMPVGELRTAIAGVLGDSGMRKRVAEMQQYTRRSGGYVRAVDAILANQPASRLH